jgi:hypothetical protein
MPTFGRDYTNSRVSNKVSYLDYNCVWMNLDIVFDMKTKENYLEDLGLGTHMHSFLEMHVHVSTQEHVFILTKS